MTKNKNVVCVVYRKHLIRFKETETFSKMKKKLGISKGTMRNY